MGGSRRCWKYLPVLRGDVTKASPTGDIFDHSPYERSSVQSKLADRVVAGLYPFCFFFGVFSAPFLGRALLQGGISARNICSFRADLLPLLLAKMCPLFLFLFWPLDFCSFCGFCSLCAPDTTFSALCTALVAVIFTAFTTSRFMCWVFRCHSLCIFIRGIYIFCFLLV